MRVYRNINNAKVVAVSDVDPKKARNFAEKYGVNKFFTDYVDILEIKDLDLVDICTPTSTHSRIVCDAAKFGHNILLEKPMARSTLECDKIISETKRRKVKLCVCHNQLFLQCIRQLKSMVDSGYYDLTSFRTSYKASKENTNAPQWTITQEEKGILWEMGYHLAYLQLEFLKSIKEVYAFGSKVKYPVYDIFAVLLRTENQSYGLMEFSMLAKELELVCEVDSSDGKRAQINLIADSIIEKKGDRHSGGLRSDIKRVLRHFVPSSKTVKKELGYFTGHYHLISKYIESLEDDIPPPVPPERGRETVKLLECIEESVKSRQPVPVK